MALSRVLSLCPVSGSAEEGGSARWGESEAQHVVVFGRRVLSARRSFLAPGRDLGFDRACECAGFPDRIAEGRLFRPAASTQGSGARRPVWEYPNFCV